ncbi:MAG TPA: hypothetical protein VLC74_09005 [Rhizomicrobium sp.]|nr:hypothetical protein [Rhizomicrobium sp.]
MPSMFDWYETVVLALAAAIAALYATRGQHLARNTLIAAVLGSWAVYRLFLQI